MWWPEQRSAGKGFARLAAILGLAACAGGCFQPLYADKSVDGGTSLRNALAAIDVKQITAIKGSDEARLAVEVRNALMYDFTGGGAGARPTYTSTTRPAIEDYGINASVQLTEIASGKQVVNGQTFARVSYDIPGQEQRFARMRGLRDAESRAAKVIADNIRSRLASYFAAGT
jgi:LPS-assembly lipoprotein